MFRTWIRDHVDRLLDNVGSVLRLLGDSPTTFEQTGPIAMATSAESVIFKSPTESNNCMFFGGIVTLAATSVQPPMQSLVRISYTHVHATV